MKRFSLPLALMALASLSGTNMTTTMAQTNNSMSAGTLTPPAAKKAAKTTRIHGETLVDEYFWMREKTNREVTAYLEAENAYTDAVMKPTDALQARLYQEMLGRIKQTDAQVPYRENGPLLPAPKRKAYPSTRAQRTGSRGITSTSTAPRAQQPRTPFGDGNLLPID